MYSYGPPHMAGQKQDDKLEYTYSSYVRIRDVAQRTCLKRWMIGRSGERGSGISVLAARHDDDDDDDLTLRKPMSFSSLKLLHTNYSFTSHIKYHIDDVCGIKVIVTRNGHSDLCSNLERVCFVAYWSLIRYFWDWMFQLCKQSDYQKRDDAWV